MPVNFATEALAKYHNKNAFDCGIEPLNVYLRERAAQEMKKKVAASFILDGTEASSVAGFYALSSTSIDVGYLPEKISKKLPRYPIMPATLIGRLAIDNKYKGKGYGELLLVDALKRSLFSTKQIGSIAVVVEAKDNKAKSFYQHFQFIPFEQHTHRLFLPMTIIESYFSY